MSRHSFFLFFFFVFFHIVTMMMMIIMAKGRGKGPGPSAHSFIHPSILSTAIVVMVALFNRSLSLSVSRARSLYPFLSSQQAHASTPRTPYTDANERNLALVEGREAAQPTSVLLVPDRREPVGRVQKAFYITGQSNQCRIFSFPH